MGRGPPPTESILKYIHPRTQGGTNIFTLRGGGQTFYVKDVGGDDDVDGGEKKDVNVASKLSTGARIFRARRALKF